MDSVAQMPVRHQSLAVVPDDDHDRVVFQGESVEPGEESADLPVGEG